MVAVMKLGIARTGWQRGNNSDEEESFALDAGMSLHPEDFPVFSDAFLFPDPADLVVDDDLEMAPEDGWFDGNEGLQSHFHPFLRLSLSAFSV